VRKPPAPAPRPTPSPPRTRPQPSPPRRPTPPAPKREEPTLDLDELAGPRNTGPRRPTRPATGGASTGAASQTSGPLVLSMFDNVYRNWNVPCQTPGAGNLRISMDVTLSADGRIIRGPTLVSPRSDPVWRAVADGAMQALVRTAPFDVPDDFTGGTYRPTFLTQRMCGG
jgi:hypothetical protein